jgi:hypothetical protein
MTNPVNGDPAVPLPPPRPSDVGTSVPLPPSRPSDLAVEADNGANVNEVPTNTDTVNTAQSPTVNDPLSNGDLPWAVVLLPTTSSGLGGHGENRHHLQVGDWVFGFFLDGDSCQQPVVVGVIPGSGGPGFTGGSNAATGSDGSTNGATGGNIAPSNVPNSAARDFSYKKLRSIGFTHPQVCGIMGNIEIESHFNTSIVGDKNLASTAVGICQWRQNRKTNMFAYVNGQKGTGKDTLELQLEFIKYEMEHYPADAGYAQSLLNSATDTEQATRAFCNYERPGGWKNLGPGRDGSAGATSLPDRIGAAKTFDKRYAGTSANPIGQPPKAGPTS